MKNRLKLRHLILIIFMISLSIVASLVIFYNQRLNNEITNEIKINSKILLKEIEEDFESKIAKEILITNFIIKNNNKNFINTEGYEIFGEGTSVIFTINNNCEIVDTLWGKTLEKRYFFKGLDLSNFPFCRYLKNIKNKNGVKIIPPYFDPFTGKIMFSLVKFNLNSSKNRILIRNVYLSSLVSIISKKEYLLKKIVLLVRKKTNIILFNSSPEKLPLRKLNITNKKVYTERGNSYIISKAELKDIDTVLVVLIPVNEYKTFRRIFYNFIIYTFFVSLIIVFINLFIFRKSVINPIIKFSEIIISSLSSKSKEKKLLEIKSLFQEFNILKNNYINDLQKNIRIKESLSEVGFGLVVFNKEERIRIFDLNKYFLNFFGVDYDKVEENRETMSLKVNSKKIYDFLEAIHKNLISNKTKEKKFRYVFDQQKNTKYLEITWDKLKYFENDAFFIIFRDVTNEIIAEESMFQSQKLELIGQMAGGIAHDFNNILSIITGNIELAIKSNNLEFSKKKLSRALQTIDKASILIKQLLTFSKKDELFEKDIISLGDVILELVDITKNIAKGVELTFINNSENDLIFAESSFMSSVLMNFIVNAKDSIEEKGIKNGKISIILYNKIYNNKRYVVITIKDNGKGIDNSILDRIFEPYFTTKPRGKGTGLGLTVAYNYVKNLGGKIFVNSKVGEGTKFDILIPLSKSKGKSKSTKGKNKKKQKESVINQQDISKLKVLVVDDENEIRENIKELLYESFSIKSDTAKDGLEAFELIKKNEYDLVLLDIIMPNLRGDELIKKISEENIEINSFFYILTGFIDEGLEYLLRTKNVKKIVLKPINFKKLTMIINDYFSIKNK